MCNHNMESKAIQKCFKPLEGDNITFYIKNQDTFSSYSNNQMEINSFK